MAWFTSTGIHVFGMAAAVPKNTVNEKVNKKRFKETTVDKFMKSTGIHSCHQTLREQTASDLGFVAAENLLKKLSFDRTRIGILIFVTLSPDYRKPATACVLQKRLGLTQGCAAMDLGHGCSGFVYGHQVIESMMMASDAEYGLLILGETTSKVVNPKDHNSMMFGDAGAAVLYSKEEGHAHLTLLRTDGERYRSIIVPGGNFRDMTPSSEEHLCADGIKRTKLDLYMDGMSVFIFSTNDVPKAIEDYLAKSETTIEDYDLVAFHQANHSILKILTKKFRIDPAKSPICLDRYGNTSSVSIPLALCDHYGDSNGEIQKILACGFGVGLSWGVTSFEINPQNILPVFETDEYFQEGHIELSLM